MVERSIRNRKVVGSTPIAGSSLLVNIIAYPDDRKAGPMKLPVPPRTITAFISLILIISIAASARGQASISVTGSVSDQLSAPIAGAHISLYSLDRILQTKSDSSGRFKFDAVPTGKYEFEVLAQGFKRFTRPNVFVTDLMRPTIPDKPTDLTTVMEIAPTGSPMEIIAVAEVAPTGSCGPSDSVTYGPRKTRDADDGGYSKRNNGAKRHD